MAFSTQAKLYMAKPKPQQVCGIVAVILTKLRKMSLLMAQSDVCLLDLILNIFHFLIISQTTVLMITLKHQFLTYGIHCKKICGNNKKNY